jgi:glycerophosphoryl diester phosphodiesterase
LQSACWSTEALAADTESGGSHEPRIIAHRGGRKWAPENTMSAFRKSLDAKVYGVELDIHRCKSGELVVIHDEDVKRTTNGKGLIKDLTWSELSKLDAGTWYSPEFKNERLPLLKDVLALADGKMLVNIEIKNAPIAYPGIEDDLIKLLQDYKYPDKILISSFDHDVLKRIHEKTQRYKLALLVDGLIVDLGSYAKSVGVQGWNPGFSDMRADSVVSAHKSGLEVNPWTVNGVDEWKSALEMGVDGIVTDDPVGLQKFLGTAQNL